MNNDGVLFPHERVRDIQETMINEVVSAIKDKKHMIVHAPTGIGKTVSVLAPALTHAIKNKLTVFFLTSRHTQHEIAIRTLKDIKRKFDNNFCAVDLIGKKWMCIQPGIENLYSNEFNEYCKKLKEEEKCEFCLNVKTNKLSVKAKKTISEIKRRGPLDSEELAECCRKEKLCPYEISSLLCKEAQVIIGDYYHVFNDFIRKNLFNKASLDLSSCIIIVDEAHNLPARIRNLYTNKLSNIGIERALKEAKKFGYDETIENINIIKEALEKISSGLSFNKEEDLVRKDKFIEYIEDKKNYEQILNEFTFIGDEIREKQKQSFIGSLAFFLELWKGPDKGFARIASYNEGQRSPIVSLSYICMDPALFTKEVIDKSYCTILMSGTLTPTAMYKDVLGFSDVIEKVYKNPFPKKNRLNLIIPDSTTKFSRRNDAEYEKIADYCSKIVNLVPGNSILFFPSYNLRDKVYKFMFRKCGKTTFLEKPNMSKSEKIEMLKNFGKYKDSGACLLGVAAGSFGEGIDLPGDLLKAVVVVGLPLEKPNMEIKELIEYYDEKFGKGWDYGYIYPAIIKVLQNAGRCIRTEEDKGVIVFLDERFAWDNYYRCFPPDMDVKITRMFEERVRKFFD